MPPTSAATADVHAKALAINLDPSIYGTIAEIGAGQEVARWFLRVGAASGTVAQTISAYDKTVSDSRYGEGTRYVSRRRLLAMLDREYEFLVRRLGPLRGSGTRFFVFADTVAARNYSGDNRQHGWIGIRFQHAPGADPSDVLIHANLMDPTAALQQEALGLLGVNLVHAAFLRRETRDAFLDALFDELSVDRLELDVLELSGPAFAGEDARRWCVAALRRGACRAIVFDRAARVTEPSNVLRKRPLIVERGRFATPAPFHPEMLRASQEQLRAESLPLRRDPVSLFEITVQHVGGPPADAELADDEELLRRVQALCTLAPVIVSNYAQTYHLVEYLRRYTGEPLRIVLGVSSVAQLMQRHFYEALPGTLLEGLGKLLARNVKMYVYPMPRDAIIDDASGRLAGAPVPGAREVHEWLTLATNGDVITAGDLRPRPPLDHLYRYLLEAGWLVPLPASLARREP